MTLLGRMIRIGRDPAMSPSVARDVVLTNIVAWLGVLFTRSRSRRSAPAPAGSTRRCRSSYALVYLQALALNYRGLRVAATTSLLLGSQLGIVAQVLVTGDVYRVHLFFLLHAVLPFLLFGSRRERLMLAMSALAVAELTAIVAYSEHIPQLGPAIPLERVQILRPIMLAGVFATLGVCAYYARNATLIAEAALDRAHQRSEELLLNILPPSIAGRLKASGGTIADGFGDVSVLFADIVGFTTMSASMAPERVVALLNDLFCTFDDLAGHLGLEKIKTIGDCYMVASGLPEPRRDHAEAIAEMALEMLRVVRELAATSGHPLAVRIGIHSGPVVAGVIGKRKFIYDLWGDTVNTASRMESTGLPGEIQTTAAARELLAVKYRFRARGPIEVKGKGVMETWLLEGRV